MMCAGRTASTVHTGFVIKIKRAINNAIAINIIMIMSFITVMVVIFSAFSIPMATVSVCSSRVCIDCHY